ncbi:unnamed protein product [Diatraea saccharalis]|uniref:Uncharacterized protein n=1 Tax=Diatraea saccharalis TaxID=40085 RepID=A0A9N9R7H2_9NEOP|nr:unnamed protein product [Diatraea saccharalis]
MKILEDLCDCKATVSEHLMQLGIKQEQAEELAQVIKEEIEGFEPVDGKEKIKETQIVKKILNRSVLSEDLTARVCQIARNAYRDYWYRKKLLEKSMAVKPEEPWEIAAQHTLELYKRTKPSFGELTRATVKIQAAYRGYHVRRNLLGHLKPKPQKKSPKRDTFGPPVDIAASREIDLGPMTAPPEVIPDVFENEVGSNDMKSVLEAQEEPEVKIAEEAETEPAQEVPEDLDEQTEATSTTASVPSSAPITAENTDVEDTGEALDTTGEEAEE